jgi:hypothetical protein
MDCIFKHAANRIISTGATVVSQANANSRASACPSWYER